MKRGLRSTVKTSTPVLRYRHEAKETAVKEHVAYRKIFWGDLDALDIVFYPRYYEWMDGCTHLFFDSLGLNMGTLIGERHIGLVLVESSCRYTRSGRYFQDIRIATTIQELTDKTVTVRHCMSPASEEDLMVEGTEKRICLDTHQRAAVPFPEDIFSILQEALRE
jgi:YbgC/YbaW family acyl-CoA thioester hydrolase